MSVHFSPTGGELYWSFYSWPQDERRKGMNIMKKNLQHYVWVLAIAGSASAGLFNQGANCTVDAASDAGLA
jgi:hypothetical protein